MRILAKVVPATLIFVLFSATTAPVQSQQQFGGQGDSQPCNTPVAAIGGALIGALLGGRKHRVAGAAVGGAVGAVACVAVNYHSKQVKSAQQVNQEFKGANGGELPMHAAVVRYETRFDPVARIQQGGSSSLDSYIEVAEGTDGAQPIVEEQITLIGPDGKQIKSIRKQASGGATAGAFETQFAFTMPQGVVEGDYQFQTQLLLNGQDVRNTTLSLQVVAGSNTVALR
jgi:outer membrane lipoprotein SlyB